MERSGIASQICRFGLFEVDLTQGTLTRQGAPVKLQEQPFLVLAMLLEHPGEIVTREDLRHKLWPQGTFVDFDGSLNAVLKRLRAALNDDPDQPRFIETVPKRGYRFIAPVIKGMEEKRAPHASAIAAATLPEGARAGPRGTLSPIAVWTSAQRIAILLGILLVALGGIAAVRWYGRGRPAGSTTAAAMKPIPTRKSIAVLGFQNTSGKQEDAWLSTALSEMMSTELAAGDKLRLVPGEDVSNLRLSSPWSQTDTLGQPTTLRIGTALNSDLLVLGSFASVGSRGPRQLRLDTRLQDAKTGEILAEVAEIGGEQNLFQLVSRTGGRMRERLGIPAVQESDESGVLATLPANSEAARLYSLGLAKLRSFDYSSAKDLLERAAEADPKFPLAYTMLARAWSGLGYDQKAREAAKKAFDLSGSLPPAEKMLVEGGYYQTLADPEKAISTFRVLYTMYPDSLDQGLLLVSMLNKGARREEGLEVIRQLRRLLPPASDDPRLDIWEAKLISYTNGSAAGPLIDRGVSKAQARGQKVLYADARLDQCAGSLWSEHPERTVPFCEEASQIFLAVGNRVRAASALRVMADRHGAEGRTKEALELYDKALSIFRNAGARWPMGAALTNRAIVFEAQGQLDRAEQDFREAMRDFEAVGDKLNAGVALANIADILVERGELRACETAYENSRKSVESVAPKQIGYMCYRLANLRLLEGDLAGAHQEVDRALGTYRELQSAFQESSEATVVLADILMAQGDIQGARQKYQEALEVQKKLNDKPDIARSQAGLARIALEESHPNEAETVVRGALSDFQSSGLSQDKVLALIILSQALSMQGKFEEARKTILQTGELSRRSSDLYVKLQVMVQDARTRSANVSNDAGRPPFADVRAKLLKVIATAKRVGFYPTECDARLALGELELKVDPSLGRSQLNELAKEAHDRGFELISRKATHLLSPPSKAEAKLSSFKTQ